MVNQIIVNLTWSSVCLPLLLNHPDTEFDIHRCRPHATVTCNSKCCAFAYFVHVLSVCFQPSSTLSSYVSACAYSPTNQYGVYSGPAGGYVAPGHHHWQPQSPALSHPGSGMSMHAGEIHSPMTFKHQAREGTDHGARGGILGRPVPQFNVQTGDRCVESKKKKNLSGMQLLYIRMDLFLQCNRDITIIIIIWFIIITESLYHINPPHIRPFCLSPSPGSLSRTHTFALSNDRNECKHLPNPKWSLIICRLLNIDLPDLASVRPAMWSDDIFTRLTWKRSLIF